jgi:hypothetical protein
LVLADVAADASVEYLKTMPPVQPDADAMAGDLREMLPLSEPSPATAENPADVAARANAPNLDAGAMIRPTGDTGFTLGGGGELTAEELKEIAAERLRLESLMPRGDPATIHLFGSGGMTGRKFVFVIDRSKSMGNEGLGVLDRAQSELQRALSRLTADHQFQIVAYHHQTSTLEPRALQSASAENRQKVAEFIQTLAAFGGTEHESGLIAGLAFKPDIVVLITDGGLPEMNAAQLATIRRMAGKTTQIHCLQFGNGPGPSDSFMMTLAAENQGTYKYIDVSKWDAFDPRSIQPTDDGPIETP